LRAAAGPSRDESSATTTSTTTDWRSSAAKQRRRESGRPLVGTTTLIALGLPIRPGDDSRGRRDQRSNAPASGSRGACGAARGVAALVVALLAKRFPGPLSGVVERAGHAGYALPGVVVALFETWRVEWIPRKENRRADELARTQ
jgi:hypothetical protein